MREEMIRKVQDFHGHMCPGLAIGIRAAEVALEHVGKHASDEEVVALVETDMCAVDAIQFLTGCTYGKGNLIHRDYGKNAFTFFRRSDGAAIRVVTRQQAWADADAEHTLLFAKVREGRATPEERARFHELHLAKAQRILGAPAEVLFDVHPTASPVPKKARIHNSLPCEECGEMVMETRVRRFGGKTLCLPCFEKFEMR